MIRQVPLPGDIGLVRIDGFVGCLIRVGQLLNGDGFADYEHSFVVLENGMLIEGQPGGAVIRPLTEYGDRPMLFVSPPDLTADDRQRICDAARTFEGVPYSFVDYGAIGAHRLHLPLPGLRAYVESTGHQICSQICDNSYRLAGLDLFGDNRWAGYCTPGSLHKLLAC